MPGKRVLIAAGLIVLLLCLCCLPALSEEYRELKQGMKGDDVQHLKKAMYWLGYFTTPDLDGNYTKTTAERVKQLQKNNGLEETGVADAALQELVFSGNAVKTGSAPVPPPRPRRNRSLTRQAFPPARRKAFWPRRRTRRSSCTPTRTRAFGFT